MATGVEVSNSVINQEYEPLDTLQKRVCSKNGIQTMVSAIHIGFMETRYYVHFKMPPETENSNTESNFSAEEEEWFEYMLFLEEDLHWLLKLPHHRFWSQVVYDEDLHRCLESYLSHAPRDCDVLNLKIKDELLTALRKIHKLVFQVYLRMSTYKESKKHHIRPAAFGEIIYDNFLFDIPKIMDLCALYGIQNPPILSKMVENIFSTQSKYKDDLNETSKVILSAFNSIEEKLLNISSKQCSSHNANEKADSGLKELSLYRDVINYIADVSLTLHAFLEIFPPASQTFNQNGAILRIPTFYEHVFTFIEKEIGEKIRNTEDKSICEEMKRKVVLSKTLLIRVFRNIINYTCIQKVLDSKLSNGDAKMSVCPPAENFLDIIMESIFNKCFVCDYNLLYPFETDLEFFTEVGITLDSNRVNYIFCSIHDSGEVLSEKFSSSVVNGARPKVKLQAENSHKPVQNLQGLADMLREKDYEDDVKGTSNPSEVEINSLIESVRDILPTCGEGFIEKCLEYFVYDSEKVIDAVLSGSLPDHLIYLDRNLKRVSKEFHSVLSERKNVFDNDEFDLFSRNDVNMENIHIGKKNKTPTTYETLEKNEDSEFIKQLTLAYGSEETELQSDINLYEDEYDDTYDSVMVGLKEPPIEDEPDEDSSDDQEQEPEKFGNRQSNKDFCINPAILREKAEQRRQTRGGHERMNRGGGRSSDQQRQHKDRNKAYAGNHNRRNQSDFKKSRGMGAL